MAFSWESCNVEELCAVYGASEKLLTELRNEIRDWLKLQPHLPQDVSDERLEWMILSTKMSLELAKQKLYMYYSMRQIIPEFFTNRDPRGPWVTSIKNSVQLVSLPKLGPEKCRTYVARLINTDLNVYCPIEIFKYIFMIGDIRMVEGRSLGDQIVIDFSMASVAHFMKFTPTIIKKCQLAATKAYAARMNGFHFINAPPFVDLVVSVFKTILSPKLAEKVYVYPPGNLESFYQIIPKSILPKDYGGDQPTMAELDAALHEKVDEWRPWFLEHEKILVDDNLHPGPAISPESLFGFSGSFRKLEVD